MHKRLLQLASLKLTVFLLVLVLIVLAAATIVETRSGAEAARAVYGSVWFAGLLGLYALNILAAMIVRWPWGRQRIGFALTHGAMLVVLAGALVTDVAKQEGHLALWEGEQSDHYVAAGPGQVPRPLPFTVRLDSFEIDTYQGTRRPAMFRSRVTVTDPARGGSFPAVIEMNRELSYAGYRLFQSSYQQAGGREMTVLAVSRDPGQPIVFAGYALLLIGMATVIGTRVAQRRALAAGRRGSLRTGGETPSSGRRRAPRAALALALSIAAALAGAVAPAAAAPPPALPTPAEVAQVRMMPVQHDGRTMPLDTLAREAVWNVTGRTSWQGTDPLALVLGWSFDPEAWADRSVVRVGGAELAAVAGLPAGSRYASYRALLSSQPLLALLRQAHTEAEAERPLTGAQSEALKLEGRLMWLHRFLTRDALRVVPVPGDAQAEWTVPPGLGSGAPGSGVAALVTVYRQQQSGIADHYPTGERMEKEVAYNRARPSRLAWWILVPAALVALAAWLRPRRGLDLAAKGLLLAGFAVMTWGLAARWQIAGRIPASNMVESLLFLGWGIGLFAIIAAVAFRNRLVLVNASAMAALVMVLVDRLPLDPFIHPMPPVLSGTAWLAIHVPIIMVSYSVLALGVVVAHMEVGLEIFAPTRRAAAAKMNDLLYWYIHIGSLLLIAGIISGSVWAASSWGRYWGWDPKEVWSLIAFLAYMAILHARFDRQLGPFGVAAASIVAFWTILMTYVGVNFVLASGLHSYGFGSSRVLHWMLGIAAAEAVFLAAGWAAQARNRRRLGPLTMMG